MVVVTRTLLGAWRTTLFVSPCLKGLPEERFEADAV
jgi:hypothetical protein